MYKNNNKTTTKNIVFPNVIKARLTKFKLYLVEAVFSFFLLFFQLLLC